MKNKKVLIIVVAAVILLCVTVSCGVGAYWFFAVYEPGQNVTPTPGITSVMPTSYTSNPTVIPTFSVGVMQTPKSTFSETFNNNNNGWAVGSFNKTYSSGTRSISGGYYVWDITAKESMYSSDYPDSGAPSNTKNFYATVDTQVVSGPTDAGSGLLIKDNDSGMYGFAVLPGTQEYEFYYNSNGTDSAIVDYTTSSSIKSTGINNLKVSCVDGTFKLYINDVLVNTVTDTRITSGNIGLLTELFNANDHAVVQFSNFGVEVFSTGN